MTQAQLKTCTAKVRRAAEELCGDKLIIKKDVGYVCPSKHSHLYPIPTGFCDSGWHEGMKIDKPTCKFWMNCPCDCHTQISRMYALVDQPRVTFEDNSSYVPDDGGFIRVSLTELVEQAVEANPSLRVVASPAPAVVPSTVVREFATSTNSGRIVRGQLEAWVKEVTDAWAQAPFCNCTPQYVAGMIKAKHELEKLPSTGAIDAVFRRWEAIGFANIKARPTRFAGYTLEGIQLGLEGLKRRSRI